MSQKTKKIIKNDRDAISKSGEDSAKDTPN